MTTAGEGRLDPATDAKVLCVAGARPNFMKIAPILAALRRKLRQYQETRRVFEDWRP